MLPYGVVNADEDVRVFGYRSACLIGEFCTDADGILARILSCNVRSLVLGVADGDCSVCNALAR
jgi:hypothetical protein